MSLIASTSSRLLPTARRLPTLIKNRATSSKPSSIPTEPSKSDKMTPQQIEETLEKANEAMKAYYSYPTEKVIRAKKARFNARYMDNAFYLQLGMASTLLCAFLLTPFLGRKIAQDEQFRKKYIPSWFDYTLERPRSAWTKEELHEQVVEAQRRLHERAIRGEFTPERLEEMRRNPEMVEEFEHFARLHPGVEGGEDD